MLRIDIVTIFPEVIDKYLNTGVLKRIKDNPSFQINTVNLRDFTNDKHRTVDDTPYGGGAGMVMLFKPMEKAILNLRQKNFENKVVLFSPQGDLFNQKMAQKIYENSIEKDVQLILLCPRYEGIDARILHYVDYELSIGPYILTGAELAAMVFVDVLSRFVPGVLGNKDSLEEETSFETVAKNILINKEYPQYTKPADVFTNNGLLLRVPEVLRTGNHQRIKEWRDSKREVKLISI